MVGCFSIFTLVSFYKAISGEGSCGCFGAVTVNPWITTVFDIGMIVLLVIFQPRGNIFYRQSFLFTPIRFQWFIAYILVCFLVVIPTTMVIMSFKTISVSDISANINGKDVTLEPMNWIGKPFPLDDSLDVPELPSDWRQGEWTVLLHHRNCSICKELLQELATKLDSLRFNRLAIIEVPDGVAVEMPPVIQERAGLVCSLHRSSKWFAPSPVVLIIENGIVAKVQIGSSAREYFVTKNDDLSRR
jgi:hypothetical protein